MLQILKNSQTYFSVYLKSSCTRGTGPSCW